MNILVLDSETESHNKGHPYDSRNRVILCGFLFGSEYIETMDAEVVKDLYNKADVIVGFNLKFDLVWLRNSFGVWPDKQSLWDCQIAHFIINNQRGMYPSLDDVLDFYGLERKLDIVKTEYWDKGRLTSEVPYNVLSPYLEGDVRKTAEVYKRQMGHKNSRLIRQDSADMLCLAEMEWNGMLYDTEGSLLESMEVDQETLSLTKDLDDLASIEGVNWDSPGNLSAVLFGGEIKNTIKEEYLFSYADKKKLPVMKTRSKEVIMTLPRLVEPTKETKRPGVFSVGEDDLRNLKTKGKAKSIIDLYLKRIQLRKLSSTYLKGIPELQKEKNWEDGLVHGSLNQVRAVTGRLSSDSPNMQNMCPEVKKFFVTRY